jgi:hypothetical protein
MIDKETKEMLIEDSIDIANQIINSQNGKKNYYVCIGASSAYAYFALKAAIDSGYLKSSKVTLIPISGMSEVYKIFIPNDDIIEKFCKHIKKYMPDYNPEYNIVLIDHSYSSGTIYAFTILLTKCFPITIDKIKFVNLIDTDDEYQKDIIQPFNTILTIKTPSLMDISGHTIPRAVPEYLFFEDLAKEKDVNYTSITTDVRDLIDTVYNNAYNYFMRL